MGKMYWDEFSEEYVLKIDDTEPPERYVTTYKGLHDIYSETYLLRDGHMISVAYSEFDREQGDRHVNLIRDKVFKDNGLTFNDIVRMVKYTIPPDKFDKYYATIEQEE